MPWWWVPSLYFSQGIPYVVVSGSQPLAAGKIWVKTPASPGLQLVAKSWVMGGVAGE